MYVTKGIFHEKPISEKKFFLTIAKKLRYFKKMVWERLGGSRGNF